jgi:Na+-transporting methylmalonyl-CoA/oxaloacetate decarboxylase gamma subunit
VINAFYIGLMILVIALFFTFLTITLLIFAIKELSSNNLDFNQISHSLNNEKKVNNEEVSENSKVIIASAIAAYLEEENSQTTNKIIKLDNENKNISWEFIGRYNQLSHQIKDRI